MDSTANGPAKYSQTITEPEQQQMELSCIAQESPFRGDNTVRRFWMDAGKMIGASNGEETRYIMVEWKNSGEIHGRPISLSELRRKGASI